jgi:hypothetical protein
MRYARLSLMVFLILQAADGLITYGAVSVFGVQAEGNPLLATWMAIAGPGAALFGAKLIACGCAAILYVCGARRGLAVLTVFYAVAVVLPWLHTLATMPRA